MKELAPDCVVEHEPIGSNYMPRKVFRNARAFHKVLGGSVKIQRKFVQIEDAIAKGTRYIDVGCPTYAWLPSLHNRFAGRFEFIHLVRNPFHTAASLLSHGHHVGDHFSSKVVVFGTDPHLAYPEFRDAYAEFSPDEGCLYIG